LCVWKGYFDVHHIHLRMSEDVSLAYFPYFGKYNTRSSGRN
jgi:hypothetical protein